MADPATTPAEAEQAARVPTVREAILLHCECDDRSGFLLPIVSKCAGTFTVPGVAVVLLRSARM